MTDAYPLKWPAHFKRTADPEYSQFKTSFHDARKGVFRQLELMGATGVVITTNIPVRQDGRLSARPQARVFDTGVAVYYVTPAGQEQCIVCDKWIGIEENIQAIHKMIEALRGLERWGGENVMNAAFSGFAALPANVVVPAAPWFVTLGVEPNATQTEIRQAYKQLATKNHPDVGGSIEEFNEVKQAYDRGMEQFNG